MALPVSNFAYYFKMEILILLKRLFSYTKIYLFSVNPLLPHKQNNNNLTIKKANHEKIRDTLQFQPTRYLKVFKKSLDSGDKGYLGYFYNRCIHRSWALLSPKKAPILYGITYQLNDKQLFIHYCETAPYARGMGAYPKVLNYIRHDYWKTRS